MRRSTAALVFAATACLLAGCLVTEYKIDMEPQGPQMQRTLSVSVIETDHPTTDESPQQHARSSDIDAQVKKAYEGKKFIEDANAVLAQGGFGAELPNDIGGAGRYFNFDSTLGSAWAYGERIRGNDDQVGVLQEQFAAIDTLADLAAQYVGARLGDSDDSKKLQNFIRQPAAKDFKNICLQIKTAADAKVALTPTTLPSRDVPLMEVPARAALYLAERDYFTPADAQAVASVVVDWSHLDANEVFQLLGPVLHRLGEKKIGVTAKFVDQATEVVRDPNLGASFQAFVEKTPAFAAWAKTQKDPNDPNKVVGGRDYVGDLGKQATGIDDLLNFGPDDRAEYTIKCTTQPIATNGEFDANLPGVRWAFPLNKSMRQPPIVLFAVAATADAKFQTAHFGRVLLTDKDLLGYCMWRRGLTAAEGKQWDDFVAAFKPTDDPNKFRDFHFAGRPAAPVTQPTSEPARSAVFGADVLLHAVPTTQPQEKSKE